MGGLGMIFLVGGREGRVPPTHGAAYLRPTFCRVVRNNHKQTVQQAYFKAYFENTFIIITFVGPGASRGTENGRGALPKPLRTFALAGFCFFLTYLIYMYKLYLFRQHFSPYVRESGRFFGWKPPPPPPHLDLGSKKTRRVRKSLNGNSWRF